MIFYVVELLDDWNVDIPSWKYPRNLESPRLWQRFQDDGNKQTEHSIRPALQLSSATGTTVSRQTVYRRLGHIGLYARRPVRCVPLTATHCRLRLTWSREHALWTPQQWSCVVFSDESRFSSQSDSLRTLIWRAPGTRYHQENTIERHRYGGAGWLVWGGIILGSRTDLYVQSVTMTGHIYRDVILEQHVRLFGGKMGAEFLFMDTNARPHHANIVDECLQSEDITRMDWPAYSPDLNPIEHVVCILSNENIFVLTWLYARGRSDRLESVVGPSTLITLHSTVAFWLWLRQDHKWRRRLQKSVCKFKMQQSIEQRYAIKFCVRLGKSGASMLEMIQQAYGMESLSQAQVFRWHKMFKEGRESMEDEPRAGRPST
ncbi:transposable element Tcb1 transposase [Trichonephila clavipes]|nr:transposable element Tcb1 transposase [Trichonephila clavipes]